MHRNYGGYRALAIRYGWMVELSRTPLLPMGALPRKIRIPCKLNFTRALGNRCNLIAVYVIQEMGGFGLTPNKGRRFPQNQGRGQQGDDRARFAIAEERNKETAVEPPAMV